jgi:hypothetical protein
LNNHSETGCAAQLCDSLTYGGYSDWVLPSDDELKLMYENMKLFGVGGFANDCYSSSSEMDENKVWGVVFSSGVTVVIEKDSVDRIRAIRKF